MLEGSGLFSTYQLQTNYRSNQEILDFANVNLANIEANQYANIQLRANSFAPVTQKSFEEKVNIYYEQLPKLTRLYDMLPSVFVREVKDYMDEKLANNEQIAVLAYRRNDILVMEDIIRKMYPDKKCVNIIPERIYNTTIFSQFIRNYWNDVKFIPSNSFVVAISQMIGSKLPFLLTRNSDKAQAAAFAYIKDWLECYRATIEGWQREVMAGRLSEQRFRSDVKDTLLEYEIKHNAVRQHMSIARNRENKQLENIEDADFLFSTIHSAKGLEFENTIILYRAENNMNEENKRMYYVALTRAIKSEFIVAYGTLVNPKVVVDYEHIVDKLQRKQSAQTSTAPAQPQHSSLSNDELAEMIANAISSPDESDDDKAGNDN